MRAAWAAQQFRFPALPLSHCFLTHHFSLLAFDRMSSLLLAGFLYPILIIFAAGVAKVRQECLNAPFNRTQLSVLTLHFSSLLLFVAQWRDDDWELSPLVVWTNFLSGLLLLLLFFSIAVVFQPWWIGAGLMLAFVLLLMAVVILPRIKEVSERRAKKQR